MNSSNMYNYNGVNFLNGYYFYYKLSALYTPIV